MDKDKERELATASPVRVGISIGDINGIGPEVLIKALSDSQILVDCTPVIYASTKTISYHKKAIKLPDFMYQACKDADEIHNKKVNVINVWNEEIPFELGKATEVGGKFALMSLEAATKDLAAGKIDVLVTAPISKEAMKKTGFKFPGHTEYLAEMAGMDEALMMMVSDTLRVALVTTHIPINEVSGSLSIDKIYNKILAVEKSLKNDFGITRPKIAVLGLNPHAGENGKMGTEDLELILPAINKAKEENNVIAVGPFPADGFFGSSSMFQYDAVLAMYHDQGLIPFKAISFDEGVNFTAGLPVVRTSPDHGTAFDIVGQGIASAQSMRNAIYLAMDVFRQQKLRKEITANPLKIQAPEKKKAGSLD